MIMFRIILIFLFVFVGLLSSGLSAANNNQAVQHGRVIESICFQSVILDRNVKYSIYLPSDYDNSQMRYPVVYLLHGLGDNEISWLQWAQVNVTVDNAIASRQIPAMIIVMPDAQRTFYINDYRNEVRYEDMFIQELIPHIDKTYRTRTNKRYRAISGNSMGGYGSLTLAMRHPGLFSSCMAFSAGVHTDEAWMAMDSRKDIPAFDWSLVGKARLNEHYKKYSPMVLAKTLPAKTLESVKWYLDCGDGDSLCEGNCALYMTFRKRKLPIEYRVRDGGHSWAYWRSGLLDGLKFAGRSFLKQ